MDPKEREEVAPDERASDVREESMDDGIIPGEPILSDVDSVKEDQ